MNILIVCNGVLPQAAEIIQKRFRAEAVESEQLLRKGLSDFDYVVIVDDIGAIRVSRKNTFVGTCTMALMKDTTAANQARGAGASAVFSQKGTEAANYIRERGTPAMSRSSSLEMKRPTAEV